MASYVVNPSKKVSEILSRFLEFDPKQLQIGIWSGDLSIRDVNLKREAFAPLLNRHTLESDDDDDDPPLHLKLISGKVGHMRIQIPWKRLVWGEGAVRLHVSDVDIVLAYETRDETRERLRMINDLCLDKGGMPVDKQANEISDDERELKQRWLYDAEKRQLQGLSIPPSFDEYCRRDCKVAVDALGENEKEAGLVDSYLRQLTSSMMWRFVSGLQASIRNIRVVLVQDGIEVGVVQHAMEVKAAKQIEPTVFTESTAMDASDIRNTDSGSTSGEPESPGAPLPDIDEYKGDYDDGEHVDKTIEVQGLGVFVRRQTDLAPAAPLHLEFSHSINSEHYIVRPMTIGLSVAFFYPHPPDRQRKKKRKEVSTNYGNSAKVTSRSLGSDNDVSTESSKPRRGKRVKARAETYDNECVAPSTQQDENWADDLVVSTPLVTKDDTTTTITRSNEFKVLSLRRSQSASTPHRKPTSLLPPMSEICEGRAAYGSALRMNDGWSLPASKATLTIQESFPPSNLVISPRLELQLTIRELKTVYSSAHHHHSMIFLTSLKRMRLGRPNENIRDHLHGESKETLRSIMVETPMVSKKVSVPTDAEVTVPLGSASPTFKTPSRSPSVLNATSPPVLVRNASLPHYQQMELKLTFHPKRDRHVHTVVKSWWMYAYNSVFYELRQRKKKRSKFDPFSFKFDWDMMKWRRREYINLYLRQSVSFATFALRGRSDEETMRSIEDELNVEQILLYRSIARALHVRGIHEIGDFITCLHDSRNLREYHKKAQTASHSKTNLRRIYTSQSTGEFAVNEAASMTNVIPSVGDIFSIEKLREVSSTSRSRRIHRASSTLKSPSNADRNQQTSTKFESPPRDRKTVGFASSVVPKNGAQAPSSTKRLQKLDDSDLRSFKTAISSNKSKTVEETVMMTVRRTNRLRFSFTFNLKMFELLVLSDEPLICPFEALHFAEYDPALEHGSCVSSLPVDAATSDDISHLTDDANFPDKSNDLSFEDEVDSGPALVMDDFLTFGKPRGVVLEVSITSLNAVCGGLSGGSKRVAFTMGIVSILGEENCQLLTAGTINSEAFSDLFSIPEINLVRTRKESVGRRSSTRAPKEALRANFLLLENQENFLEVDLARIVLVGEMKAVASLRRSLLTSVRFPRSHIADTELDVIREYLLHRSKGNNVFGHLEGVDCALRCHGFDIMIPSSEYLETSVRPTLSDVVQRKKGMKVSLALLECYTGTLVEHICSSRNGHRDETSRLSVSGNDEDRLAYDGLKLIDIDALYDQQHRLNTQHAIVNVSSIQLLLEISPIEENKPVESIPLHADDVDIEIFLTANNAEGLDAGHIEFNVAVSPLVLWVSQRRQLVVSEVLEQLLTDRSASGTTVESSSPYLAPPRFQGLSEHMIASVVLTIVRFAIVVVSDTSDDNQVTLADQEIIVEDAISDYLSFLSCFDFQHPVDAAIQISRLTCIERLIGAGFEPNTASECVEAAARLFEEDIELVRATQRKALHDLSLLQRGTNDSLLGDGAVDISSDENETHSVLEDNSEESFDILETALQNAVEQTLSGYLHLLQSSHELASTILAIEIEKGFNARATKFFYDSHFAVEVPHLTVHNCAGLQIISIRGRTAGLDSDRDELSPKAEDRMRDICFALSVFYQDIDFDFAQGGLTLSVLGCDTHEIDTRRRECLVDAMVGTLEVHVCSKVLGAVMDGLGNFAVNQTSFSKTKTQEPVLAEGIERNSHAAIEKSVCVEMYELHLVLFSDEMNPFTSFTLRSVLGLHTTELVIEARDISLLNLTPEGQYYPLVVQNLKSKNSFQFGSDTAALRITYSASPSPWRSSSKVLVEARGIQIILLNQYLSELTQFLTSPNCGVGWLLSRRDKNSPVDYNGNPPPPLMLRIIVSDSSLVMPRSSISPDVVSIEFTQLAVVKSYHVESFKVADASGGLRKGDASCFDGDPSENDLCISTKITEFYDCMDHAESGVSTPLSSFDNNLLLRFTVTLKDADIYTALPRDRAKFPVADCESFLREYRIAGRASENMKVFAPIARGGAFDGRHPPDQLWERVTSDSFSLEILIDFAPKMRLLITDEVSGHELISSIDLDTRMSQFYLLLSVWYDNMQELPVLFPYSVDIIKSRAMQKKQPQDFPDYGSTEYVERLLTVPGIFASEIVLHFSSLTMRCGFDPSGYFETDPASLKVLPHGTVNEAFRLTFKHCIFHVTSDEHAIMRIGCGAHSFRISDQRKSLPFNEFVLVDRVDGVSGNIWADLFFGLQLNGIDLERGTMSMPFQASIFMTPGWVLINLGVERLASIVTDFTPVWILLDFFSKYYSSAAFGYPLFEAVTNKEKLLRKLEVEGNCERLSAEMLTLNVDFRLWLLRPQLCIPSDTTKFDAPSLRVKSNTGFWYKYTSMASYSSQEMGSTNLSIQFSDEFQSPQFRNESFWENEYSNNRTKKLIDFLSFGLRIDFNSATKHSNYAFSMPMWRMIEGPSSRCSITSSQLEIHPLELPRPTICTPTKTICRDLGMSFCEMTVIIEVLPQTTAMLFALLGLRNGSVDESVPVASSEMIDSEALSDTSFTVSAQVENLRFFIIDPTLGVHLPLAVFSLSSLTITSSQLGTNTDSSLLRYPVDCPPSDLQVHVGVAFWTDYFKLGITRSWEPLVEPFACIILYEKSRFRGDGITLTSEHPFHVNVTGALLLTVDDAVGSLTRAFSETFIDARCDGKAPDPQPGNAKGSIVQEVLESKGRSLPIDHQIPSPLRQDDRIAFSLLNLTGQDIRVHQILPRFRNKETYSSMVTYLEQSKATRLEFQATVTVIRNLRLVEVPFPGLPHQQRDAGVESTLSHSVDIQLPGFKWLEGISVDTSGRRFHDIIPRSAVVHRKVSGDWRLGNAMKLLTEVGFDNGGRVITVRSLFEMRNHTTHSIKVLLHPDPIFKPLESAGSFFPGSDVELHLDPGGALQIPMLLLEAALRLEGKHLGCLWVKPSKDVVKDSYLASLHLGKGNSLKNPTIGFSSRPLQLAKLVHESSLLFQDGNGEDIPPDKARTGIQSSCPIADGADGVPVAPFCYAIEIRRSPIVGSPAESHQTLDKKVNFGGLNRLGAQTAETRKERKPRASSSLLHVPVAYTLIVQPPIVIENLLPAHGRFELMHATRRTVLWFADLKPGETVSVHTVGLDAPLLLLVNLGFSKTPVGEGALVHHGSELKGSLSTAGLKSLGKAVTKGTKQIGKTLTSISDSPDRRGKGKLFMIQNPQLHQGAGKRLKNDVKGPAAHTGSLGLDTDVAKKGRIHVVDERIYDADEIATETVVVDGVGQKLTLKIENIRGGGGQRRISLFCPFWIVNTTEHALRYKQEKTSTYVAGTVCSPDLDGSKNVDGSRRNVERRMLFRSRNVARRLGVESQPDKDRSGINFGTVFSGTPGAFAAVPCRPPVSQERLAKLLESELPLEDLASIAFMFNFQEDGLLIGHQRLAVQLSDGTRHSPYFSDWSQGFSLETIGVPQVIGMHCKDGRVLELSVTISVAPDFLSGYTKVVRFTPRYIMVNRLNQPIRIWQDSSLLHPSLDISQQFLKDPLKWRIASGTEPHSTDRKYDALFGGRAEVEEIVFEGGRLGTTAHKLALFIATIGQDELVPFHLPDTRGDRQFRIDLGGDWILSPSFDADVPGEHTFNLRKSLDLRLLRHVNTRASPHYKLIFPPVDGSEWDGELGIWFETAWGGDRKILVKGTKRGRYAFNNTDIRIGDELLRVDNLAVAQLTFAETMKLLKERLILAAIGNRKDLTSPQSATRSSMLNRKQRKSAKREIVNADDLAGERSVVLTFRTLEERLRRVRVEASRIRHVTERHSLGKSPSTLGSSLSNEVDIERTGVEIEREDEGSPPTLKVEMRAIHNSIFVVVRQQSILNPPYTIENRAINHFILFRQRGCFGHPWNILQPGETTVYCWEEPTKSHKLTLRVGGIDAPLDEEYGELQIGGQSETEFAVDKVEQHAARKAKWRQSLSFHNVDGEDEAGFGSATTVKLDEIGFACELPCPKRTDPGSDTVLNCCVDSNGATRVLVISNNKEESEDKNVLHNHVNALRKSVDDEMNRIAMLQYLLSNTNESHLRGTSQPTAARAGADDFDSHLSRMEEEATFLADFPEHNTILRRHQLVIQVLEAAGLRSADVTSKCNPYCEVLRKGSKRSESLFSSTTEARKTYFVEGTYSPKWIDQTFVFDIPPAAIENTREHAILVRIRAFRFIGQHPYLGQTTVHLRTLRNQNELVGWYPLVGKTGPRDLEDSNANWGRGSVKLRVQWIFTVPALITYFIVLNEKRLCNVERTLNGMVKQLENLLENEANRKRLKKHEITKEVLKDPFGVATRFLTDRNIRQEPWSSPTLQRQPSEKLEGNAPWSLLEPMKNSRDKLLWFFHFQTQEIRRARKTSLRSERLDEVPLAINASEAGPVGVGGGKFKLVDNEILGSDNRHSGISSKSLVPLDEDSTAVLRGDDSSNVSAGLALSQIELSNRGKCHPRRPRSVSLEDIMRSLEYLEMARLGQPSRQADTSLLAKPGMFSGRIGSIGITLIESETEKSVTINALLLKARVFHQGRPTFHRNHLTYNFRLALNEGTLSRKRPKSRQRVSNAQGRFKTWVAATVTLNDSALKSEVSRDKFEFSLMDIKSQRHVYVQETVDLHVNSSMTSRNLLALKMAPPTNAPAEMRTILMERAKSFGDARMSFNMACMKSLKAALHPGGSLIIRPITVLNLPQSYSGMSVKIRSGSLTLSSTTVDARVTPVWARERSSSDVDNAFRLHKSNVSFNVVERNEVPAQSVAQMIENDLEIPVDPQKTSGSIRLVVIGERLNKREDLGVLDIPLGTAIRCCLDSSDNDQMLVNSGTTVSEYVRWFPLRNPKDDDMASDGDMGYGGRPLDTEQETDTHFGQYFSPCIRLSLLWYPRASDDVIGHDGDVTSDAESSTPLTKHYLNADISRISTSLIDSQLVSELLALSVSDICIRYFVSKAKTRFGFVVGWIQIDHQMDGTKEPIILAPTPVVHSNPTLQFLVYKDNLRSKGKIDSYELIAFFLEELDLTIEESLVLEVWNYLVSIGRRREVKRRALNFESTQFLGELIKGMKFAATDDDAQPSLLELLWEDETSETKTYIEKLYLGPVRVNLTYIKGRRLQNWDSFHPTYLIDAGDGSHDVLSAVGLRRNQRVSRRSEIFARWAEFTHDEDLLNDMFLGKNLPNILASVLPSVSEAPIRLQGKGLSFIFEDKNEIVSSLKTYYATETLKQIYKIIGSLDIVGNPAMLVSSVANGVRDFFVTPSKEFRKAKNPSRLGLGLAKGTLSLFSHSASGLFGFVAKMSATAAQTTAVFSFDSDFQQWHREHVLSEAKNLDRHWKRRGIGGISRIFTRPLIDLTRGIVLGASGLILSPIKYARNDGPSGLARGVAVGAAGVFVKPVVGILDAFSHFTGSIHDVAKSVNVLDKRFQPARRLRLPYTFSAQNVLIPFNPTTARSVLLLRRFPVKNCIKLPDGKIPLSTVEVHIASEVFSVESSVETLVVISTLRVVLVKVKRDANGMQIPSLSWEVPLRTRSRVSSRISSQGHNGVALTIVLHTPVSKETKRGGWHPVLATQSVGTPTRRSDDPSAVDNVSHCSEDDDEIISPSMRSVRFDENVARQPSVEFMTGDLTDGGDHRNEEAQFRRTMLADTGEVMDIFTVLAEFDHRRQLCRLHNAICCITGNMESIIRDRGIGVARGTEGYTSFGEFSFNETLASSTQTDETRVADLELVPWVPHSFFDLIGQDTLIDVGTEFVKMRRGWKLEKEYEASDALGGPKWFVKARAEAIFIPLQAPQIPSHLLHAHSLQMILDKFHKGAISFDEAIVEVDLAIEGFEGMISDETNAAEGTVYRHIRSSDDLECSRDHRESFDDFKSTVELLINSSLDDPRSPSILNGDSLFHNRSEDETRTSVYIDTPEGGVGETSGFSQQSSIVQQDFKTSVSPSRTLGLFPECPINEDNRCIQRPVNVDPRTDRHEVVFTEGPMTNHSEQMDVVRQSPSNSDPRVDRLEMLLEKLLEVSIVNAQQWGVASRARSDEALLAVRDELSSLRTEIERQRKLDDVKVDRLQSEVSVLKGSLGNIPTVDAPWDSAQGVENNLKATTEEFKSSKIKRSLTLKNARRKIALTIFQRRSPRAEDQRLSIQDDEDLGELSVEEDGIGLDDFEMAEDGADLQDEFNDK